VTTTVDPSTEVEAPVRSSGLSTAAVVNIVTAIAVALFWLVSTSWHPWNLFARAGFSADFYDEQARVFLRGRLAVDPAVPGPEGFLIDGGTYLYYGPFLSIRSRTRPIGRRRCPNGTQQIRRRSRESRT